jgi:hypothetical protein
MRRREFIGALGGAAAWPFAARAQAPTRIPRIGIIDNAPIWDQFRSGLRDHGYVEGRNIVLEYRTAQGKPDLLAAAAAELARLPVDVIATPARPRASPPSRRRRRSRSSQSRSEIRCGSDSWQAWPGRAETSPAIPFSARTSSPSGCSCCES